MIIANSKSVPIGFSAVYISICHFTLKGLRLLVRLLRGVLFAWCVLHFDQAAAQSIGFRLSQIIGTRITMLME